MRARCCLEPGLVDPAQDVEFFWLAPDGTQQSGSERALRAALAGGALSATTLVWRKGWNEWLPAQRVAALASSLPPPVKRETRRDGALTAPPVAPVSSRRIPSSTSTRPTAPALRAPPLSVPAHSTRPSAEPPRPAADPAPPSSFGNLGRGRRPAASSPSAARPSGTPPPPPVRSRSPMPTLSEEQGPVSVTATLRPPGAVPPPARGVPMPAFEASPRPAASMTPVPSFGPPGGKVSAPAPPATLDAPPRAEPTTIALGPALEPEGPLESSGAVRGAPLVTPIPLPSSTSDHAPQPAPARDSLLKIGRLGLDNRSVVMALSAFSGALSVALLALWWSHSRATSPVQAEAVSSASAAAPVPAPAPSVPPGCKLSLPAARVAPNIERSVPPYAAKIAGETALALGIAGSKTKGVGLHVDPNTLDVLSTFEEEGKDTVRGVVPLTRSGSLGFFVDRDDRALRSAHTVDEIPPFTLGVSDAGFSRVVAGSTSLVWPLAADAKITEPRSAALGNFGYGVTFRRGGQSGAILLGFVGSDGAQKSELAEVPSAPKFLGTPMIAGSERGALVAFAGRDTPEANWKLYVSLTQPGAAPSPAQALSAGEGGSVISPALAALPGDRWLVQWTEGGSGQYHVHVQSFTSELAPIAQSVLVSPKGANAGQGALATFADGALTLFILTTAGHDELWGATLSCH